MSDQTLFLFGCLIALMVVAGAAGQDKGVKAFSDRVMQTTISAFHFG